MQHQHARRVVVEHDHIQRIGYLDIAIAAGHVGEGEAGPAVGGSGAHGRLAAAGGRLDGERKREGAHFLDRQEARAVIGRRGGVAVVAGHAHLVAGGGDGVLEQVQHGLKRLPAGHQMLDLGDPGAGCQAHAPHLTGRWRTAEIDRHPVRLRGHHQVPGCGVAHRQGRGGEVQHQLGVMGAAHTGAGGGVDSPLTRRHTDRRGRLRQRHAHRERGRRAARRGVVGEHHQAVGAGGAGNLPLALQVEAVHAELDLECRAAAAHESELVVGAHVTHCQRIAGTGRQHQGVGQRIGDADRGVSRQHGVADCAIAQGFGADFQRPHVADVRGAGDLDGCLHKRGRRAARRGVVGEHHQAVGAGGAGNLPLALQVEAVHAELDLECRAAAAHESELVVGAHVTHCQRIAGTGRQHQGVGQRIGDADRGVSRQHGVADCAIAQGFGADFQRPHVADVRGAGDLDGCLHITGAEARVALVDGVGQAGRHDRQGFVLELGGVAEVDAIQVDTPHRAGRRRSRRGEVDLRGGPGEFAAGVHAVAQAATGDGRGSGTIGRQQETHAQKTGAAGREVDRASAAAGHQHRIGVDQGAQGGRDLLNGLPGGDGSCPGLAIDGQAPGFALGCDAAQCHASRGVGVGQVETERRPGDGDEIVRSRRLERAIEVGIDLIGQAAGDVGGGDTQEIIEARRLHGAGHT